MKDTTLTDFKFHCYTTVTIQNNNFPIGYHNVPKNEKILYSMRFVIQGVIEQEYYFDRMVSVMNVISPILYVWIIDCALDGEEGMGSNCVGISFSKKENYTSFDQEWNHNVFTDITYPEGIQLFYAYFSAYKKFIETQAPEMKDEMYSLDFSPEAMSKPWYPDFCDRLKKLKDLYNSIVEAGEIDPSNIQYPK